MFAPMSPMTERICISNERQLNDAHVATYFLPKYTRLAVLVHKLTLRRPAMPRPAVAVRACTERE